ncbi:MAG: MBOAT family protein, partial [Bacteroidales bacterium]|nr:MBOAT family protein [Bacteroidales bacterium]
MEFNSWSFVMFFPVVCLLYWCIKGQRFRNVFLLAASYYFYMCWNASYGLLLLTSTLISYGVGLRMESTASRSKRKWLVSAGVVLNLALIAYFKYANFGVETVNWVMRLLGVDMNVPLPNILLPVG